MPSPGGARETDSQSAVCDWPTATGRIRKAGRHVITQSPDGAVEQAIAGECLPSSKCAISGSEFVNQTATSTSTLLVLLFRPPTDPTRPRTSKSIATIFIAMNAPRLLSRRALSECLSPLVRRPQRPFSTTCLRPLASFQSYPLPSQPPSPQPRNTTAPETSITQPLPRVHETRPPPNHPSTPAVPEQEAQQTPSHPRTRTEPSAAVQPLPPPSQPQAAAQPAPPKPRSKLRAPRKAAMQLTPAAVSQLRSLLSQPDPKLIKVGVRNRGCSGLAYHLEYVDTPGAFDETVEQDGVRVLIDSKALFSIIGSEMDWVEDKLSQRFVFRNPNISEFPPSPPPWVFRMGLLTLGMQRRNAVAASRLWYEGIMAVYTTCSRDDVGSSS